MMVADPEGVMATVSLLRSAPYFPVADVAATASYYAVEAQGGAWDAFFWVRDASALYGELSRAGAVVVYGPLRQPAYDMLEFAVRDCDGHVLGFGQPLNAG